MIIITIMMIITIMIITTIMIIIIIRRASGPRRVRSRVKHPLQCLRPFDPAIPRSCDPGVVIGCFFLNKRAPPGGHLGSKRPCQSRADCTSRSVIAKITRPKILQKIASILIPKCIQNGSKIDPKIHQKFKKKSINFCIELGYHFECILGSFSTLPTLDF